MSVEQFGYYKFQYCHDVESPGKVRVYVLQQPSYQSRDTDMRIIHRWPEKNGAPPYICIKEEFKPHTFADAQRLAHGWANLTDKYIETGLAISDQIARE